MEISLTSLRLRAIVGILKHERKKPQKIILDASFSLYRDAEFLDYRKLKKCLKKGFKKQEFLLLEDALKYFESKIFARFKGVRAFRLKITKKEIFNDCEVSLKGHFRRHHERA